MPNYFILFETESQSDFYIFKEYFKNIVLDVFNKNFNGLHENLRYLMHRDGSILYRTISTFIFNLLMKGKTPTLHGFIIVFVGIKDHLEDHLKKF